MARDTGVVKRLSCRGFFEARVRVMAIKTFFTVEVRGEAGCGDSVRIVAGDAAEFAVAVFEAQAFVHLLNMVYGFGGSIFGDFGAGMEDCPELIEVLSRAEVVFGLAVANDARGAGEVALIADAVAKVRREFGGINDGIRGYGRVAGGRSL